MKKLPLALCTALFLLLLSLPAASIVNDSGPAGPKTAVPASATIYINGIEVVFGAYNINGSNYIKLRDLAYALLGTEKQFALGWDAAINAITMLSGQPYAAIGGEMTGTDSEPKPALAANFTITLDSRPLNIDAYNIGGNNYFKLRELGQALDFHIFWDESTKVIHVNTGQPYEAESGAPADTSQTVPGDAVPLAEEAGEFAAEVTRLVNEERAKRDLAPLTTDSTLNTAAQIRAVEIMDNFSHTRPDGSLCFTVLKECNISYRKCAENIARGQTSPENVVSSWMDSPGHRANILGNYTQIGVGVIKLTEDRPGYAWVQLFI